MAPAENNRICTIPNEISNLVDLGLLGMEYGGLTVLIPSKLGHLDILYFLDLDFNQLTGSIPYELLTQATLEQIYLNKNRLSVNVEGIELLRGLVFIHIHNNSFTGTIPPEIGDITDLGKEDSVKVCDAQVLFYPSFAIFYKQNRRRAHI